MYASFQQTISPLLSAKLLLGIIFLCPWAASIEAGQGPSSRRGQLERALDSVVLIVCGAGAGRETGTASGAIVRSGGVILTTCTGLDEARETQVRLRNGEIFDQVELLGIDRRRCVAALRIHAQGLPPLQLAEPAETKPGSQVYSAFVHEGSWALSQGLAKGVQGADKISSVGRGYSLIQFSRLSGQNLGGVLLDAKGRLLGIHAKESQGLGLAVPVHAVLGLADRSVERLLGEGAALETETRSLAAQQVVSADPDQQLLRARTIYVRSSTVFLKPTQFHRALLRQPEFRRWNLKLIKGYKANRISDLTVHLDRPLFTYYFTFDVTDNRTGIVLGSGKVTALDGNAAAPMLARRIIKLLERPRDEKPEDPPPRPYR